MISAIILAGGEGRRMNERNKGLVNFHGKPLISHVIKTIAPQVEDITISANNDIESYKAFGYPVIQDTSDSLGPLSGIQSAGHYIQHYRLQHNHLQRNDVHQNQVHQNQVHQNHVLILPCDIPILPNTLANVLSENIDGPALSVSAHGRLQPLVSLVEVSNLKSIDAYLATGGRSVKGWLEVIGGAVLAWPHNDEFQNVNSLKELETLEQTALKHTR